MIENSNNSDSRPAGVAGRLAAIAAVLLEMAVPGSSGLDLRLTAKALYALSKTLVTTMPAGIAARWTRALYGKHCFSAGDPTPLDFLRCAGALRRDDRETFNALFAAEPTARQMIRLLERGSALVEDARRTDDLLDRAMGLTMLIVAEQRLRDRYNHRHAPERDEMMAREMAYADGVTGLVTWERVNRIKDLLDRADRQLDETGVHPAAMGRTGVGYGAASQSAA
jgi:hypothetical protein